jgi:hypothetical protein
MNASAQKILLGITAIIVATIFILPIGIRTGVTYVSITQVPEEKQEEFVDVDSGRSILGAYRNEADCTYLVRMHIEHVTLWRYSDSSEPELPSCEFLSFAWHEGWLIDPGTILF